MGGGAKQGGARREGAQLAQHTIAQRRRSRALQLPEPAPVRAQRSHRGRRVDRPAHRAHEAKRRSASRAAAMGHWRLLLSARTVPANVRGAAERRHAARQSLKGLSTPRVPASFSDHRCRSCRRCPLSWFMLATVDALLPLSLLEAVRDVDTPEGVLEAEFVDELRNKRFGLSDTVYSQIKRYTEAVRRNQRTAQDEAVALARLIGRRPDAEAVLRAAGRFLAREAYMTISPVTRAMVRMLPAVHRRGRWRSGSVRRMAQRYLNAQRAPRRAVRPARGAALRHARRRPRQHRLRLLRVHAARAAAPARGRHRLGGAHALRGPRRRGLRVARRLARRRHRRDDLAARPRSADSRHTARAPARARRRRPRRLAAVRLPGRNPIAGGLLGLQGMVTRRIFVWIPREGVPQRAGPRDRAGPVAQLADGWRHGTYSSWRELEAAVGEMVKGQAHRDGVFAGRRGALPRPRAGRRARDGARRRRARGRLLRRAGHALLRRVDAGARRLAPPRGGDRSGRSPTTRSPSSGARARTATADRRARGDGVDPRAVRAAPDSPPTTGPTCSAGANAANPHYEPSRRRIRVPSSMATCC